MTSWFPVIGWAGLIFYLSSVPHLKTDLGIWDLILRKCAHVFEYAVLGLLLVNAWRKTWQTVPSRRAVGWCIALGILYAASDEFHQSFVPGRGPSVLDVTIDSFGVVLGAAGFMILLELKKSKGVQ